jgi:hypothetical protein
LGLPENARWESLGAKLEVPVTNATGSCILRAKALDLRKVVGVMIGHLDSVGGHSLGHILSPLPALSMSDASRLKDFTLSTGGDIYH